MGGVAQVKHDEYSHWTGGKPNLDWTGLDWTGLDWTGLDWTGLDWTGLDPGTLRASIKSTQYHPINSISGLEDCSTGFPTKFSLGGNLSNFQKKVFECLEMHGMDSIGYLPETANPMVMDHVVTDHTHFTHSRISSKSKG